MISHELKVIFIHVPKTAGTSVEAALGHHGDTAANGGVLRGAQDHRSLRQLQWPHGGLSQLSSAGNRLEVARAVKGMTRVHEYPANRLRVDRARYDAYFKFAVIRNPWARAYSCYRNVLPDALHRQRLGVAADISFADFLATCVGTDMLRPQTHWLIDFTGRIGLDYVCRYETLEHDYAEVCRRANLPGAALPHLNRGAGEAYLDAFDDRTRAVIADYYRAEIERFGYTYDGVGSATTG